MGKMFYTKLAISNIRKNSSSYIPFILSSIGTVAMFFMIYSLSENSAIMSMSGSATIAFTLNFGAWVTGIFAAIFLFYTNSFLMKRRKKEIGLLNILGMEKKHVSKMILLETAMVAVISILAGLISGVILSRLASMLLVKILNEAVTFDFELSTRAILYTLCLFGGIFLAIFINCLRQIHLSKPVELLKGGQTGEREPKSKWILTVLGVALLGTGYYLAITTTNPMAAMSVFMLAAILVMLGTYCLFISGSIVLLKLLRKNKKYYYKTKHFLSVSGMIYRMKQNAVGLGNICILSTAVLVMVSSTLSMYIGMKDVLFTMYPKTMQVTDYSGSENKDKIKSTVDSVLESKGLKAENADNFTYLSIEAYKADDTFVLDPSDANISRMNDLCVLAFIPLSDYNNTADSVQTLSDNEILLYSTKEDYTKNKLSLLGYNFDVKKNLNDSEENNFEYASLLSVNIMDSYIVIVKDMNIIKNICQKQNEIYGDYSSRLRSNYTFDLNADKETIIDAEKAIIEKSGDMGEPNIRCRDSMEDEFYKMYGGLFFLGIFLGLLFIMATVMIIYYKQISEGYDDQERFRIMKGVGLSKKEIRQTIRSQVLTVFFLPLVMAGVHIAVAFPAITRILKLLSLTNVQLFAICTVVCFLVFALFYALIYIVTARKYYKIVGE